LSEILLKKRLAELSFNQDQKKFLDLHHCDLSNQTEIRNAVIRAVGAVGEPMNIPNFKRVASELLREEPKLVSKLTEIGADEDTRRRVTDHLVDATFSRCLTDCLISV
jgi:hypothetical protein